MKGTFEGFISANWPFFISTEGRIRGIGLVYKRD